MVLTGPQEVLAIAELTLHLTVAEVYEEAGVALLRAHGPGEGAEE